MRENKVFDFESPADPYISEAAVVCCFDARIRLAVQEFLRSRNVLHPDMIVAAGGGRNLASPRNECEREFVLEQIEVSVRLHQAKRAIVMNHSDCGAYGGLAAFNRERRREMERHGEELARAGAAIRERFPDLTVETYFVAFDGIFAIETPATKS